MPLDESGEDETLRALHALLRESLTLWRAPYRLDPLAADGVLVLRSADGERAVRIVTHLPRSDMIRWVVTRLDAPSGARARVCSSILGILDTLREMVDADREPAVTLASPPSKP